MKTIHRRTLAENFTTLPNALLQNPALSFRARGMLAMMLSMPEDWQTYQTWIEGQAREGKEAVRSAVKELEAAGLLKENGRVSGMVWHWSDTPQDGKPAPGTLAGTKYPQVQKSKESEVTSLHAEKETASIPSVWKPCGLSKEQKLAIHPNAEHFPSEAEFDQFLHHAKLTEIIATRPDIYLELCTRKWRHWRPVINKWVPIRDWRAYVKSLNGTIAAASLNGNIR